MVLSIRHWPLTAVHEVVLFAFEQQCVQHVTPNSSTRNTLVFNIEYSSVIEYETGFTKVT